MATTRRLFSGYCCAIVSPKNARYSRIGYINYIYFFENLVNIFLNSKRDTPFLKFQKKSGAYSPPKMTHKLEVYKNIIKF